MTSLWRHLWPNYDTLDFKILTQCVKMLGERVLQVWRWYLQRFRRYRKKTRGGARNSPPPSGARVKASTAKLAFLPASSHTPLYVFTCSCKSTRLITCNSFDEVNWLIKKLAQMTGQTHKWETPSRISQVPENQDGGVTLMAYMASLRHLGFASHLRERHPLLRHISE